VRAAIGAGEIARRLAGRIDQLVAELLPAGRREGHEWRCGSVAGEPGDSLGVHLYGDKAGVWADFSTDQRGDALDLVVAVLGKRLGEAMVWSRRWLGLAGDEAELPARATQHRSERPSGGRCRDFWRAPWRAARAIPGTPAERYLGSRCLRFLDPLGRSLRFAACHPRRDHSDKIELHPALLALLRDVRDGRPCGIINIYLRPDGDDRLRDPKGKTSWGRAAGAAVMLSGFGEPTYSLTICEGVETGIGLLMADLAPVWCCGGSGNLSSFPVLSGVECLTVAADADPPGQRAAAAVAKRWQRAGRDAVIVAPAYGDWADVA